MTIKTLTELLTKLGDDNVQSLASSNKINTDASSNFDGKVKTVVDSCYKIGIDMFVNQVLKVDVIKKALSDAKVEHKEEEDAAIREKFRKEVDGSKGIEGLLEKLKIETLKEFVELMDFETDAKTNDQFSRDIVDEVLLLGARSMLAKASLAVVKKCLKKLNFSQSGKRPELEDRLLDAAFPGVVDSHEEPPAKPKTESTPKKETKRTTKNSNLDTYIPNEKELSKNEKTPKKTPKKEKPAADDTPKKSTAERNAEIIATRPPLEKGITYEQVFQGYWADDLKNFCRANNLKSAGSKGELIKRILEWFENPEQTGRTEKKRKKKASAGGRKKVKKNDGTAASTSTTSEDKEEEEDKDTEDKEAGKKENGEEKKEADKKENSEEGKEATESK